MLKALFVFLFFASLNQVSARTNDANKTCFDLYNRENFSVQACPVSESETIARLTLKRNSSPSLVINALYDFNNPSLASSSGARFWKRLWVTQGDPRLGFEEQQAMRAALLRPSSLLRESGFLPLIDVLANFVQPDTRLTAFDILSLEVPKSSDLIEQQIELRSAWTMICEFIGGPREAHFSVNEQTLRQNAYVGLEDTRCRGRCGLGCWQIAQWKDRQYTQECLNHDICHDSTGEQLGECKDEFWLATASYVLAPDCP